MAKRFNVTGACSPRFHYMVNIEQRLRDIRRMVDRGDYFTINRARQYGKTTTLGALERFLQDDYVVIHTDFQMLSSEDFASEQMFVRAFVKALLRAVEGNSCVSGDIIQGLERFAEADAVSGRLSELFPYLSGWCGQSPRPVILMIDEVDSASNNQVFIDFLAQLRGYYLLRTLKDVPTFWSVILAGVHDIKHIKGKISRQTEPNQRHGDNSPWNIAADFLIDMSFDKDGIKGMLDDYEKDYHTGMDTDQIAELLYEYTSGYPYLVSRICNIMDERLLISAGYPDLKTVWTKEGFLESVRLFLSEKNSLFESLINKLTDYPELGDGLYDLLFSGKSIVYNPDAEDISAAQMFGFIKESEGTVVIANRIFEIRLYNYFLSSAEIQNNSLHRSAIQDKNLFIENGRLNMRMVLERFTVQFTSLYGSHPERFHEEEGRKYFLMFLRPIINGTGNYYIEPQTRTATRSDVIVDYRGEQFVIELKIWRGQAYHAKGEKQLVDYLKYYHLKTGYMLTFNFNEEKTTGIKEVFTEGKYLVEAFV